MTPIRPSRKTNRLWTMDVPEKSNQKEELERPPVASPLMRRRRNRQRLPRMVNCSSRRNMNR